MFIILSHKYFRRTLNSHSIPSQTNIILKVSSNCLLADIWIWHLKVLRTGLWSLLFYGNIPKLFKYDCIPWHIILLYSKVHSTYSLLTLNLQMLTCCLEMCLSVLCLHLKMVVFSQWSTPNDPKLVFLFADYKRWTYSIHWPKYVELAVGCSSCQKNTFTQILLKQVACVHFLVSTAWKRSIDCCIIAARRLILRKNRVISIQWL